MGQRGPRPTPKEVLKLRGSWRGDLNPESPPTIPGRPPAPAILSSRAKTIWNNTCDILERIGVLSCADIDMLTMYCITLDHLVTCERVIQRDGMTYEFENAQGAVTIRERPEVKLEKEYIRIASRLAAEFGLSPSARARVTVETPVTPSEDVEQFFKVG